MGLATAELYSVATGTWVALPRHAVHGAREPLRGRSCRTGRSPSSGGRGSELGVQNAVDLFTLLAASTPFGSWTHEPPFAALGRVAPAMPLSNGAVLLGAGFAGTAPYGTEANGAYSTEADLFDPTVGTWVRAPAESVSHVAGAALSVVSGGTTTSMIFGGFSSGTIEAVTGLFSLDANGQPACIADAECQSGACADETCRGLQITIDATAEGPGTFNVQPLGTFDRSKPQVLNVIPSVNGFAYDDSTIQFTFSVKANGALDWSPSVGDRVTGRGGTLMRVSPTERLLVGNFSNPGWPATFPQPEYGGPSAGSTTRASWGIDLSNASSWAGALWGSYTDSTNPLPRERRPELGRRRDGRRS